MTQSDFWTRRKASVDAETREEERRAEQKASEAQKASLEEKSDEQILRELDLPDPETLETGDDFGAFLQAAVPDRLKRAALRRLWSTNPLLANLDGLVEYGEDYTDVATVIENLTTTYRVGKGMVTHVEEMLQQAGTETDNESVSDEEIEPVLTSAAPALAERSETEQEEQQSSDTALDSGADDQRSEADETIFYAKHKRMRYRFVGDEGGAA